MFLQTELNTRRTNRHIELPQQAEQTTKARKENQSAEERQLLQEGRLGSSQAQARILQEERVLVKEKFIEDRRPGADIR